MAEDQEPDQANPAGGNPQNPPFPGMGTPVPSAPEVKMPAVDTNHRNFDSGGQATAIAPPPPQQPVAQQKQPDTQPQQPDTPDHELWEGLNRSQLYSKGYDEFKKKYNNTDAIDKLYQGLSENQLYSKSKEDFYGKYFAHLPSKEVADAHDYINTYLNSPKANAAIDKITEDSFYNNIYQQQQQSSQGKDATRIQQALPIRLPGQVQQDRRDYSAQSVQDPTLLRHVLTEAKKQNPEDAPDINHAAFVAHANTIPHSDAVVKYYGDQIKSGKLDFDINANQIVKPVSGIDAFFNGMKKHSDDQDAYKFYSTHNDDDVIKKLDDKGPDDPFKPVMKAQGGWGRFLEGQGSNAAPLVKFGLPAALLNPFGATAAAVGAAMGAYAGSEDLAHSAYKNTLEQSYHDYMSAHPDANSHDALAKAKEDAHVASMLAAGQGIALSAGGALGKEVEFAPVRYSKKNLNALTDIGSNIKSLAKNAVPEISTQAGIAAAVRGLNNAQQGKVTSSGVVDEAGSMALFTAGMIGLKVPGAFRGGGLSDAGKANLMDLYAKSPEPMVDAGLANAVKHEAMTPQEAGELKVEINAHKKATEGKADLTAPVTSEGEDLIDKYEKGQLPKYATEEIIKVAKHNGVKFSEEEKDPSVEDIYNKLKHRQSAGKVDNFVSDADHEKNLTSGLTGINKETYEKDPEGFLKMVADQAHSGDATRTELESGAGITKSLIDHATSKYPEHIISSPKIESNEEANQGSPEASARGERPLENKEGEDKTSPSSSIPIKPNVKLRTLDYGDWKGQPESKEAQEQIKQEILSNEPIGKTGERFQDFTARLLPEMKELINNPEHNGTVVTHSSVIKALKVWEEMGRPDKLEGEKLKEFAQKYVDLKPEKEGHVNTFVGDNGTETHVIRHGETEDNKLSEFRHDDTQLTDKGIAQATAAGKELYGKTRGKVPSIHSSDLPRTIHTSDIVDKELNNGQSHHTVSWADAKPKENATAIRSDQGQGGEPGTRSEGSEDEGRKNLQLDEEKVQQELAQPDKQAAGQTDNSGVNKPPSENIKSEPSDDQGTGISKQAIYEQYGKKFEKTPVGWNEVSKNAVDKLTDEAQRKGTSVAKEAESQVMQMAFEMKTGNLSVSENRITAATLHLMNQDEAVDNLTSRIADNPTDKAALGVDLEIATQNRDATLKVIRGLGEKSGRNLGLFAGMFSKTDDGGIAITRKIMESAAGITIPETMKELEANTTMTASEKSKARFYIEKLDQIKADYEKGMAEAKKMAPKESKPSIAQSGEAIANKIRKNAKLNRPGSFSAATPASLVWDAAVEVVAQAIEKGALVADAIARGIEHIKNTDWYKSLSQDKKDQAEKDFTDWHNDQAQDALTPEEKNVIRLQKKLDDLRQGIIKQTADKRIPSDKEKALQDEIFEAKKNAGLVPSKPLPKKPEADLTPAEKNIKRLEKNLEDLRQGIVKQQAEKREITPEEKDLQEKIFEAKKNLGLVASKGMPKSQEEIRLESAMKAAQKSLEDYQRHLDNNTPKSKDQKVYETEELKALRKKRDDAKAAYAEMIDTGVKPRGHKAGFDVKEDARDAAIMFQKRKTEGQLKAVQRLAEDTNRGWWNKALDWNRSFLIGGLKTLLRVGEAGGAKLTIDPIANLTTGNIASLLPGLRGRGVSPKTVGSGLESLIKFPNDKAAMNFVNEKQSAFEKATNELNKNSDNKDIQKKYMQAEMDNAQAQIYRMIHGNVAIDMEELAKFGSTDFDQTMGGYSKVNPADLHGSDKLLYYLNSLTRLHGVEKAPSARRALVEGYNSKLLEYQKQGLPLSASTRMRALDMAYLDFLGGKYQESTQLGDYVNEKKYEGQKPNASLVKKALSAYLRVATPVAKIAINITKKGLDSSTLGVEGFLKYIHETSKGMKLNEADGKEYDNIFKKLEAGAERMPEADKRYIHDVIKHGLFGAGLYLYAMNAISRGAIQYGGEYDDKHFGNARRKYKGADGKWYDDLDYGQWVIEGHKFGKFGSSVLNHLPQFMPIAMAVNTHNVYQYEKEYTGSAPNSRTDADKAAHRWTSGGKRQTKDWSKALWEATKSDVNEITERLPFNNILNPMRIGQNLLSIPIAKDIGEHFDTDENGNQIERHPTTLLQQGAYNLGLRKFVDKKGVKEKVAAPAPKPSLPPTQYNSN